MKGNDSEILNIDKLK